MLRTSTTAQAIALLVLGYVLVAGEPGVLIGVLGAALWAWGLVRHTAAGLRTAPGAGPAVLARALRQSRSRAAVPRQQDPDAAGHARPRAPSGLVPAV
ncbi:DUF6412 domain-containing protein [Pseudonocardia asaccharolytica]|uniref:Uncharacterized protein n=1 Tax=Pseudonocardia asaccharolytica DSM 44247 = NBRC 16224 TaxID=1123024 RepID=A0A511D139_9PSEU|nr:DUF6412 domain-containing protein [Pseudonocardia asaccharolytica]GEL18519.1 hypothetical protein PA7_23560 [Pseudonocardia asaccharolytica DSM 44247 = NBRC 16224]